MLSFNETLNSLTVSQFDKFLHIHSYRLQPQECGFIGCFSLFILKNKTV